MGINTKTEKGAAGHRHRLRECFLSGEAEARSEEMLLELLLTFAIGRKDVKPLAQELIRTFGGLSQILSASPGELYKVKGIGQSSVTLLKVIRFFQTGDAPGKTITPMPARAGGHQHKLFESPVDEQNPKHRIVDSHGVMDSEPKEPAIPSTQPEDESEVSNVVAVTDTARHPRRPPPSKKTPSSERQVRRKFQVSNGCLLEFDQLARMLHFLLEHRDAKKINRKVLREDTGLADRQVASLVSMGSALGPSSHVLRRSDGTERFCAAP